MKIKRVDDCVIFEIPANEVHVAGNTARIYRTLYAAETIAFAIAMLSNEHQMTQEEVDAEIGADEYRREKAI